MFALLIFITSLTYSALLLCSTNLTLNLKKNYGKQNELNAYLSQLVPEITTKGQREGGAILVGSDPDQALILSPAGEPGDLFGATEPEVLTALQSEDSTALWKQRHMARCEAQCPHRPANETRRPQGQDLTLTPGGPRTSTPHLPVRSPQWN